jgi:hypothetical protein
MSPLVPPSQTKNHFKTRITASPEAMITLGCATIIGKR